MPYKSTFQTPKVDRFRVKGGQIQGQRWTDSGSKGGQIQGKH